MADPVQAVPEPYLLQARRALANNLYPAAQAAATVAGAEALEQIAELLAERNRLIAPTVDAVRAPDPLDRYGSPEGALRCGMLRDQTGKSSCVARAGHYLAGSDHEWPDS